MSPSLAFLLGLLLGVLFMCGMISVYLLMKLFELIQKIPDGADNEVNSN